MNGPAILVVTGASGSGKTAAVQMIQARGHPEPAAARTDAWAAYLRGQADALDLPVIDTSELTVAETADAVEAQVDAFGVDPRARRR